MNKSQQCKEQIKVKYIDEDKKFTYLGSIVTGKGGTDEDMKIRIGKAKHAFITLRTGKKQHPNLQHRCKNRVALWLRDMESNQENNQKTFINKWLRYVLKLKWQNKIKNKELLRRTDQDNIGQEWTWIGHAFRTSTTVTRQALDRNPEGKRKPDRPKIVGGGQ